MAKLKDLKKQLNGTSVETAVEFFLRSSGSIRPTSTDEAAKEYLTCIEKSGVSPAHLASTRFHVGVLSRAFRGVPVHEISRSDLEDHVHGNEDWGPRTKLNHWRALRSFVSWCKRAGYASSHAVDSIPAPKVRHRTPCTFSPQELRSLLSAADGYTRHYLAIAAFTGLRSAEIHRLRWENFKWDSGVLFVPAEVTKTNRRRSVPIEPALSAWLTDCPSVGDVMPVRSVYDALEVVARKAGVAWRPNALRHSFATYHLARGGNAAETATVCGHSQQVLESRYKDLKTPAEGAAWFSVAQEVA